MPVAKPTQRRASLQKALSSTVEKETITLDELIVIWGTAKGTFVNTRNVIPDFPEVSLVGERGKLHYPRKAALESLLSWETRGDRAEEALSARRKALLGQDPEDETPQISLSEMSRASALMSERDARLVEQKMLVRKADLQVTASKVFEVLNRNLSRLPAAIDPNGELPEAIHLKLEDHGKALLLRIHGEMRDTLSPDVRPITPIAGKAGTRSRRSGQP